jgi:hypothetical protein
MHIITYINLIESEEQEMTFPIWFQYHPVFLDIPKGILQSNLNNTGNKFFNVPWITLIKSKKRRQS